MKSHKIWLIAVILIIAIAAGAGSEATAALDPNWTYRKKITIQTDNVDSDLTDFPIYVYLDPSGAGAGLASKIRDDGYDIRFTRSDGETEIPYERELYSESGGNSTGHFWVKTPVADGVGESATEIYMYYGYADAADGSDPANVWSANYQAVWHMGEASWNGSAGEVVDSAGANDGVSAGNATTVAGGKIGRGGIFDGTGDYVDAGQGDFEMDVSNKFTISMWVKPASGWRSNDNLIIRGQYVRPFRMYMYSSDEIRTTVRTNAGTKYVNTSTSKMRTGRWSHVVLRYDNGTNGQRIYIDDGPADATGSISGTLNTLLRSTYIASTPGTSSYDFPGEIDEVRITNNVRTDAELKFEYYNMSEADNELTWSSEDVIGTGHIAEDQSSQENLIAGYDANWAYRKKITIQTDNVDADLTDFPLYVYLDLSESGAGLASKIRDDGYDIRFTQSDGNTELPYERELYSEAGGNSTGHFWVKTPIADGVGESATEIYMYYGYADAADGSDTANVWSTNYQAVLHMGEASWSGSAGEVVDSAGNNAGVSAGNATTTAGGKINRGGTFDGTGDLVEIPDDDTLDMTEAVTVSLWVKNNDFANTSMAICKKYDHLSLFFVNSTDLRFLMSTTAGNKSLTMNPSSYITEGEWHYYTMTYNRVDQKIYIDGTERATVAETAAMNPMYANFHLYLGTRVSDKWFFDGTLDEVRIADNARNAAEIKFEYYNMGGGVDNELTWGSENVIGTGSGSAGEVNATTIYRSVGTSTADLNTNSRTVTISGTTATFSGAMPGNIGVGDVLQYQVNAMYYIAFISGRTSATVYTVKNQTGGTPQPASAGTAVRVYRAHNELPDWEDQVVGDVNPAIHADVDEDVLVSNRDLTATDTILQVACYGDGEDTGSARVTIDAGWVTSAANYIRIYTPFAANEVGATQRHNGAWDTSAYRFHLNGTNGAILIQSDFVRIDGLQVQLTSSGGYDHAIVFQPGDGGDAQVSNCIVRGAYSGTSNHNYGIMLSWFRSGARTAKIYNNIVYDFANSGYTDFGGIWIRATWTSEVYNNTVHNSYTCIDADIRNATIAKNNIVQDCAGNGYEGTFNASSTNNNSDITSDAPGDSSRTCEVMFADEGNDDFHIDSGDTCALDYGTSDVDGYFTDDIDGQTRTGTWDIGADEYSDINDQATTGDTQAPSTPANLQPSVSSSTEIALIWDASSDNTAVIGYKLYRDGTEIALPGLNNYTDTGLAPDTTYIYKVSAYDTAGNESAKSSGVSTTTQPPVGSTIVYEDAEDGTTDGWYVYDTDPAGATINNVYDVERRSRVISFQGEGTSNGYRLRNADGTWWYNDSQFVIEWSMNYTEWFHVFLDVQTTAGHRYIYYTPDNSNTLGSEEYVHYGLGSSARNGTWHTFTRDLQADLNNAQPGVQILEIKSFLIRGTGSVDDIKLHDQLATADKEPPSVPTNIEASAGSSTEEIFLTWDDSSDKIGVSGYRVYRDGTEIATTSSPGYADTGLVSDTTYIYEVSAYDAVGNVSAKSAPLSVDIQGQDVVSTTVYEDAQNGDTAGWFFYDSTPGGATIANIYDSDAGSRAIKFQGFGTSNGYRLWNSDGARWNNDSQFIIEWSMKYAGPFKIYIDLETIDGRRLILYDHDDSSYLGTGLYVHHGLGLSSIDGTVQTFTRDLEADLTEAQPDNYILKVNGFLVRGSGLIYNIKLHSQMPVN